MIRVLPCVFACVALSLAGCGDDPSGKPAPGDAGAQMAENEHGERRALGSLTVAGHTFEVIQFGDVAPGADPAVDLEWPAGAVRPAVVRAWIGVESAVGSRKALLQKEGDRVVHGHLDVPKDLPADSRLWIEIEDGERKGTGSIAWR